MHLSITGGIWKGRRLQCTPGTHGIRPTSGKVREALFSILAPRLTGAGFLDLFAGTGAVGIEAVSRGAASATLVEKQHSSLLVLKANLKTLKGSPDFDKEQLRVIPLDTRKFCDSALREGLLFDVVFADPPFSISFDEWPDRIRSLIKPGGVAILQYPARLRAPWVEQAERVKNYGESSLAFFEEKNGSNHL